MRFNEQGRSMIEMLGVLAIVGVLSVGGIAGYSKAMNKFKTNKLVDQISMISTNLRTLYSSQGNYTGLSNRVAIATGSIPSEMYSAKDAATTSDISNSFGGKLMVGPITVNAATPDDGFYLTTDSVPQASCVSIATTEWGSDAGSGLVGIGITSGTAAAITSVPGAGPAFAKTGDVTYGLPYNVANASIQCNTGGNSNIIYWIYN